MSGDHGESVTVPAAFEFLQSHPEVRLIVVGDQDILKKAVSKTDSSLQDRVEVAHASEVVGMDEDPRDALRKKKDSSMRVALDLVKGGVAQACVSSGNTGALMATARFVLKTLPGIDRPAIVSSIPAIGGHTLMLDLGANSDCTAEQLYQFALMGSVIAEEVHAVRKPAVALLNIGAEEIKGNDTVRQASKLLADAPINYIGYVEGNDIFSGDVDVVVTDGFTGNVALKTIEGAAKMLSIYMREEFTKSWLNRLLGVPALPVLRSFRAKLDPRRYNGASLVGLRDIVIKSHGGADALAFEVALNTAVIEVQKSVPKKITRLLEQQLNTQAE